jgi:mannitol 2-dehydrogenase
LDELMNAIKLNQEALDRLPADVSVPRYDRKKLTPGILHIGVGNFHRAHQATYLNRLFNAGSDHDWGIVGAGVRPNDAKTRELLRQQDWLSTVIELDPAGYKATVCGAMIDYLPIDPQTLVEASSRPEIRIVSLTVTEGGYYIDANTGGFDADHPDIIHDIENPADPRTVFGILLAGLASRRERNLPPFTIVSCDNLPENGRVARQAMVGLAAGISAEKADWMASEIAFPNGMVDCITPATGERERALAVSEFGIEDASPVVCEPFHQWVLEDRFTAGRPALEKVGVEFVTDVAPYELMKLRILNGGHATIAYAGALLGHHFVHDAMGDPLIRAFLEKLELDEIIPTLPPIPGVDFHTYLASVMERFANPKIGDTIPRLCLDGSNRQPKFILPTLSDRLNAGLGVDGLALEVALWCRYCAGRRDDGGPLTIEDENAERLGEAARRAEHDPAAFLSMTDIFGPVGGNVTFAAAFTRALKALYRDGIAKTIDSYANGGPSDPV